MNRNLTLVLLALFAGLLGYVLIVQLPKDRQADQPTATPDPAAGLLFAASQAEVKRVRLEDPAGNRALDYAMGDDGNWTITEPAGLAADQAAVAGTLGTLTSLTVNATVTSTTDLTVFGVVSPTYRAEVYLTDGRRLSAAFGDKTPPGTAYYVLRTGDTYVVTVAGSAVDNLFGLLDNPPAVPTATPGAVDTPADASEPAVTATP